MTLIFLTTNEFNFWGQVVNFSLVVIKHSVSKILFFDAPLLNILMISNTKM